MNVDSWYSGIMCQVLLTNLQNEGNQQRMFFLKGYHYPPWLPTATHELQTQTTEWESEFGMGISTFRSIFDSESVFSNYKCPIYVHLYSHNYNCIYFIINFQCPF